MKQAEFSAASRGVLRWLENVPDESAPEDEGEEVGNRSGKEVKKGIYSLSHVVYVF
jgi:hypothetical protein